MIENDLDTLENGSNPPRLSHIGLKSPKNSQKKGTLSENRGILQEKCLRKGVGVVLRPGTLAIKTLILDMKCQFYEGKFTLLLDSC